jgi:hypothetical protein
MHRYAGNAKRMYLRININRVEHVNMPSLRLNANDEEQDNRMKAAHFVATRHHYLGT